MLLFAGRVEQSAGHRDNYVDHGTDNVTVLVALGTVVAGDEPAVPVWPAYAVREYRRLWPGALIACDFVVVNNGPLLLVCAQHRIV